MGAVEIFRCSPIRHTDLTGDTRILHDRTLMKAAAAALSLLTSSYDRFQNC